MCCMPATKARERSPSATIFNENLYQISIKRRKEQGRPPLDETPGLDRSTLWYLRNSTRLPRVDKAIILARELQTTVEDLWLVAS